MPVVFTSVAKIKDWRALQRLNREMLLNQARLAGALRYRVFRNANDASEAMIVAEFPDYDAALELGKALGEHLGPLLDGRLAAGRIWEPTGWEGIE